MQIRGVRSAGQGDDQARFLSDLRALRDMAAIGYDELAARAHYPSDILKEAENGPLLPGLPVLTAYVRACEGDVLDWEERWRQLARVVAEDPGLPVRPPGASPAAVAGARAGVGVAPPDVYDPERIRAALRGGHESPDRGVRRNGDPGIAAPLKGTELADRPPAGWDADLGQDSGGWQDSSTGTDAGAALGTDAATDASPRPAAGPGWTGASIWDPGSDPAVLVANGTRSSQQATPAPPAPADLHRPCDAPRQGEEPKTVLAYAGSAQAAGEAQRPAADSAPSIRDSTSSPVHASAEPARHEKDRFFPVRLLVIIVIAALIGSVLVLLLR